MLDFPKSTTWEHTYIKGTKSPWKTNCNHLIYLGPYQPIWDHLTPTGTISLHVRTPHTTQAKFIFWRQSPPGLLVVSHSCNNSYFLFVISTLVARAVYHHICTFSSSNDEHCSCSNSCSSSILSSLRQTLCFQYSPQVRLPEASRSCDKSDFSSLISTVAPRKVNVHVHACPCSLSFTY